MASPNYSARILVVSRDSAILRCLTIVGETNSWQSDATHSGLEALERVQSATSPDLVLLDLIPDDSDSLHTLRWLRKMRPRLPVILLSQSDDHQRMLEALRLGARDFLIKPCSQEQLDQVLKCHLKYPTKFDAARTGVETEELKQNLVFVAASPAMTKLRTQAELLAQVNVPLLIVGEKGSGKRTVARLIHQLSGRATSRFAQVNCSALAGDQLEKEIFGTDDAGINNEKAHRPGRLESCSRGTLLLEEISAIPSALQFRILTAIKNQIVERGCEKSVSGVRIVGTRTTVPNSEKLGNGSGDLMSSLTAFTINIPPLRDRIEDIPVLLEHFMSRLAQQYRLPTRKFSDAALEVCMQYSWPGNVGALENFVKGYLMLGDESLPIICAGPTGVQDPRRRPQWDLHSTSSSKGAIGNLAFPPAAEIASLKSLVRSAKKETERGAIAGALEQTHWNRKAAARLLQISYRALLYKIDEYRMTPEESYLAAMAATTPAKNNSR